MRWGGPQVGRLQTLYNPEVSFIFLFTLGAVMGSPKGAVMVSQKTRLPAKMKQRNTMENPGHDIGPSGSIAFGCFFHALGA